MAATDFIGPVWGGLVKASVRANAGAFHRHAMGDLLPKEKASAHGERTGSPDSRPRPAMAARRRPNHQMPILFTQGELLRNLVNHKVSICAAPLQFNPGSHMAHDPENGDTFIAEGESWIPNAEALCAEMGIVALSKHEGELYAVVRGKGEVVFASLFAAPDRSATVRNIKPA